MEKEITEVRYLTDDRDEPNKNELVITLGGNGDWYVAVAPEGEGTILAVGCEFALLAERVGRCQVLRQLLPMLLDHCLRQGA